VVTADPRLRFAAGRNAITEIETYEDHRIAMSMALAGLRIGGIAILDPDCVGKTYPSYWDALRALGVTLTAR
jgi:3-phosphoshikimate 1-carboxyvinyltransferase